MGKGKATSTDDVIRDVIVVWWDGFGKEHQATEGGGELPVQWEFTADEAVAVCKKQIKKGAIKAESWRPGSPDERLAGFERSSKGECRQTDSRR